MSAASPRSNAARGTPQTIDEDLVGTDDWCVLAYPHPYWMTQYSGYQSTPRHEGLASMANRRDLIVIAAAC